MSDGICRTHRADESRRGINGKETTMAWPSTVRCFVLAFLVASALTGPLAGPASGNILQLADVIEGSPIGDHPSVASFKSTNDLDAHGVPTGTIHEDLFAHICRE